MSISPHFGHRTESILSPSIQNAGHIPCPAGSLMRASNLPYACEKKALRLQSRGCVVEFRAVRSGVRLLPRCNDQLSALNARIFAAIGVVLQFVIPPPAPANVASPLRPIRQRSVLPAEVIAPDQRVAFRGLRLLRVSSLRKQTRAQQATKCSGEPLQSAASIPIRAHFLNLPICISTPSRRWTHSAAVAKLPP